MISGKLLRYRSSWRFVITAALLLTAGTVSSAWCGRIDPELLRSLESSATADTFPVIVKLADKVDLETLQAALAKEERRDRQAVVVQALRDKATASQENISSDLKARELQGKVRNVNYFWVTNGVALSGDSETIRELAGRDDVEEVIPDRPESAIMLSTGVSAPGGSWNLAMIGAPALWQLGYTGQGVVVAILDSGVDMRHPALAGKWRGGSNSWFDAVSTPPSTAPFDDNGHGTHAVGVMVAGNTTDNPVGVAPGATWIAAKIFDRQGKWTKSGIHAAFQWLLAPGGNPADAPRVVNCSWSIDTGGKYDAEFAPDIQALKATGIALVFAAGNSGPLANTSESPANNPGAFSVGATDASNHVMAISSRGPSAHDHSTIFPTVTAPGSGIRTTDLTGLNILDRYTNENGSSAAAPHVAGAFALLLSINPDLTVTELGKAVISAALDLGPAGPDNSYGAGRLDIVRAAENLKLIPAHVPYR